MRTAHPLRTPPVEQKEDDLLTVAQVLDLLQVPRRTWQRWRELEIGPACLKLPNRELRVRRSALTEWLDNMQEAA